MDDDTLEIEMTLAEMQQFIGIQLFADMLDEGMYEEEDDIDSRVFEDEDVDLSRVVLESPIKLNNPSTMHLIKLANIDPMGVSNGAMDYISDVVYTKLNEVLSVALVVRDERDAKILTPSDIVHSVQLLGDTLITLKR